MEKTDIISPILLKNLYSKAAALVQPLLYRIPWGIFGSPLRKITSSFYGPIWSCHNDITGVILHCSLQADQVLVVCLIWPNLPPAQAQSFTTSSTSHVAIPILFQHHHPFSNLFYYSCTGRTCSGSFPNIYPSCRKTGIPANSLCFCKMLLQVLSGSLG